MSLAPVLVAVALFGAAAPGAGWVYDDHALLAPPRAGGLAGWWTDAVGYVWRPLAPTLQELLFALTGRAPVPARLLNVALHAANVALVGRIARDRGATAGAAAALALAWTVHHAVVDAVAWASDAGGLLSTTLGLGLLALSPHLSARAFTAACVPGLALVLLAKESGAGFLPVLVLVQWQRHGPRGGAATFAVGAAVLAAWLLVHDHVAVRAATDAPLGIDAALAWLQMLPWLGFPPVQAGLTHLFDPTDLPSTLGGALFLVAAAAIVAATRSAAVALATVAWAAALIPLAVGVPTIGFLPLRYAYAGSAVAAAILAPALSLRPRHAVPLLGLWAAAHLAVGLPRLHAWRSDDTLWASELAREPTAPAARWIGGEHLARTATTAEARREGLARMAAAIPDTPRAYPNFRPEEAEYALARTAFLVGEPGFARAQILPWITRRRAAGLVVPANAWCLVADTADRLGLAVDPEAEARCAAGAG